MKALHDTSMLRAALEESHQFHDRALAWLERVRQGEVDGVISAHVLAELYSNLTGQIRPLIPTSHALDLINRNVLPEFEIVDLTEDDYRLVLERAARMDIRGGSIYDALIVQAALKAGAEQLVTFNESDFRRISAGLPLQIVVP